MSDDVVSTILDEKAPATWSDKVPAVGPESLIEAGFHFGHRASKWNPKMKPFIRDKRNGIHIIDLKESLRGVITAKHFLRNLTSTGARVLFVGTKRQAKDIVREQALRSSQAFMCERWLGGTLTNFSTIRRRLSRLEALEKLHTTGRLAAMPKKMQSVLNREKGKIESNLDGLRNLDRLPAALVVVDASQEEIAILEANKLEIPIVAIVDSNSNPDRIDIVIPGNDDSVRGLQIVLKSLADSCIEGRKLHESGQGMASKLDIRAFDEAPNPKKPERGGRRPQRDRGAGGGRTRHARTSEQKAAVDASAEEAAKQAEAQTKDAPAPTVRRKPPAKKPEQKPDAAPAASAPKPEAKSEGTES
ncbi:MAG: 30S ribosomal protein S2 [Planctomycetes bacterium]|nr:30S ribosomal protein S2 [Planctomycetota bacterium]